MSVHPLLATTTTRYCVLVVGLTIGLLCVLVVVALGGMVHKMPAIVAPPAGGGVAVGLPPICTLSLIQMLLSKPASAIGFNATFTSTTICTLVAQPLTVDVKV